jgi:carbamoyl-phosphate synthase large subunit
MSRIKVTVALTGLNNTDNPGPGVPVIRGIRDSELFDPRIVGLAYESMEPAIYMHDIVDHTYRIPYPSEGAEILIRKVLEINDTEKIDVLIPNFDAELLAFMKA